MSETRDSDKQGIGDLIAIMAQLRNPDGGCPWDLKQDFASIAPYTIEEAYEVADAIERRHMADLSDELGDLLFQVVYHAQLAAEAGAFSFDDVVDGICSKMVRRHPHVFGSESLTSDEAISDMWERVKREEKQQKHSSDGGAHFSPDGAGEGETHSDGAERVESLLGDVPVGLPGMTRALKLQKRAARVGFDWEHHGPVLEKLDEELNELKQALLDRSADGKERQREEFGDLLFVMANAARHLGIDPEDAVRASNQKFIRRFQHIERQTSAQGKTLEESSLAEMEALWDEAKALEKPGG